jgi:hypothetical protein
VKSELALFRTRGAGGEDRAEAKVISSIREVIYLIDFSILFSWGHFALGRLNILLSAVDWIAKNPKIALLGTIASLIAIPLAVALFVLGENDREIIYDVSAPTAIVRSGRLSDLKLYFHSSEITSDVSSLQVAIWNIGRAPVRRENVLSDHHQVTISFESPTVILDAFAKPTRSIVELDLNKKNSVKGEISCSWNILEREDGVLF